MWKENIKMLEIQRFVPKSQDPVTSKNGTPMQFSDINDCRLLEIVFCKLLLVGELMAKMLASWKHINSPSFFLISLWHLLQPGKEG